jgi:ribosomal subunit interface protein
VHSIPPLGKGYNTPVNYNLKGTGIQISDELRSYVEKGLGKADIFVMNDPTAHTDVELQYLEEGRSGKYRAEFTLSRSGDVYRASCWGSTMHEAIDLASAELVGELSREKKKKLAVLRRMGVRAKDYLRGFRRKV